MKDLKKMDIGDIDRHIHCYKLFFKFLKNEKKYHKFINLMFISKKRTVYDLIKTMNNANIDYIMVHVPKNYPLADKLWSAVFTYVPFFSTNWYDEKLDFIEMKSFCHRWFDFLIKYKNI
jgi:hypothetical protein